MNIQLQNAVLEQIGITLDEFKENKSDYMDASGGISGFVYYSDTHEFAMANQELINELLADMADEQGVEITEMVKGFGVFRDSPADKDDLRSLYQFLGGNKETKQGTITNVLAWLCVETLAFELDS